MGVRQFPSEGGKFPEKAIRTDSDFDPSDATLGCVPRTKVENDKFHILAIIYDLDFITRVRNAFALEAGVGLYVCRSAEEAKLLLRGIGIYAERTHYPLPRLILLDTMTPGGASHKLLEYLCHNPEFPNVPVVLLAADPDQPGLQELLDHGANGLVVKRDSSGELLAIVRSIRAMEHVSPVTRIVPTAE